MKPRALFVAWAPRLALRVLDLDRGELGLAGEALAARFLRRRGWRLLGRRVATPCAEVDLVAVDRGELVCVEVKTGRRPQGVQRPFAGRWRPGMSLGPRQIARLRRAGIWLAWRVEGRRLRGGRVDLVEVEVGAAGKQVAVAHTLR